MASGCPINNTAMGMVSAIRFEDMSICQAEVFLAIYLPKQDFADWGGQRVFAVVSDGGEIVRHISAEFRGTCMAYAVPRFPIPYDNYAWLSPDRAQAVVRSWRFDGVPGARRAG